MVSPHLDDAVISCGLAIQALLSAGWAVFVATVFTEAPNGPISQIARRFNTGSDGDAVRGLALRRSEDRAALARLGAQPLHLGFLDASFRKRADGRWLCSSYEDICSLAPEIEPALCSRVRVAVERALASTGASIVIGPAAVGGHVDHRLVQTAVAAVAVTRGERTLFRWFEDLPYAFDEPSDSIGIPFCRGSKSAVAAKLEAMELYSSQLHILGEDSDSEGWRRHFRTHAYDPAAADFVERVREVPVS